GDLVIGQLQLLDQARVEDDLSARTAVGVELGAVDHVDFPVPLRGVWTKYRYLGDESFGNRIHALVDRAALFQNTLAGSLAQRLLVGLRVHLVDLLGGQHAEHVLLALDAHGTAAGGIDRLTTGEQ